MAGCVERDSEPVDFIKCGEFLAYPWNCQLLRKDRAQLTGYSFSVHNEKVSSFLHHPEPAFLFVPQVLRKMWVITWKFNEKITVLCYK